MNYLSGNTQYQKAMALAVFFLLLLGIGRMFSLVMHNPVLAYANSYDMIRLQACHQIWPADEGIDITNGTPSAPIHRYTLDKQVKTSCFPSSELLFTSTAIELAKLKNYITGEKLVSIKMIGFVKALFLASALLIAQLYFLRRNNNTAMTVNAFTALIALSDPGVTLYFNTFYSEFSAVYFLYLTLIGIVFLADEQCRITRLLPLLAGLIGLGFSMPQHASLALCIGLLIAGYSQFSARKWETAITILLFSALPLTLQNSGFLSVNDKALDFANKINFTGSALSLSQQPDKLLKNLQLPDNCKLLAGKTWYDKEVQDKKYCPELSAISRVQISAALLKEPALLTAFIQNSAPSLKNWVFNLYGQVEGEKTGAASQHQASIDNLLRATSDTIFLLVALLPALISIAVLLIGKFRSGIYNTSALYCLLVFAIQAAVFFLAISTSGITSLAKNLHLYIPLLLPSLTLIPVLLYQLIFRSRIINARFGGGRL